MIVQTLEHVGQISKAETEKTFIEANTIRSSLQELKEDHIIPVFARNNTPLISHSQLIDLVMEGISEHFDREQIGIPTVRVSHPVKGRVPEAKDKAAKDLLPWETTIYYERMMFAVEIPSISDTVDGNKLSLTVGGVKSYSLDNLHGRVRKDQHFKLFIGFQNKVCCNMCVWTDGYLEDVKVNDLHALNFHLKHLLQKYRTDRHLHALGELVDYSLEEKQFAQFIGKCRMYNHLPPETKATIPSLTLGDQQLGIVTRDYYKDENFSRLSDGSINLWRLYNLLTGANKSSYIDHFLERNVNIHQLIDVLKQGLDGQKTWYLN